MKVLFNQAIEARLFTPLDVQFAYNIANEENPILLLVGALLSAETMSGHVCLSLDDIHPNSLFMGRHPEFAAQLWQMIGEPDPSTIRAALLSSESVCEVGNNGVAPLILSGDFLYFQRMWQYEQCVAHFFSQTGSTDCDVVKTQSILSQLFPVSEDIDWQKIAAAVAVTSRVSVISGGPGTGKTTTVAKILALLIKLGHLPHRLRIELAAPTGKAAARLTESLGHALKQLPLNDEERALLPTQAKTLHRLLGAQPESQQFRYHRDNPLALDILIVDEASMVDLPMMSKLIEALPNSAKLIFLGDKDQLASVEAGAVLGDICRFADKGYSYERAAQLELLTGCPLSDFTSNEGPVIRDSLCLLRKSYRFSAESGIGQLAYAVNAGNVKRVDEILTQNFADIHNYISNNNPNSPSEHEAQSELESGESYAQMLLDAVGFYQNYLLAVKVGEKPADILYKFNQYRLLAALREGAYGVSGLNDKLEKLLHRQGLITKPYNLQHKHYVGRPIMISRNDSALGLFNGDIGIILFDEERQLRAYFQFPDGTIRGIQPNRLPAHETAYVMTVHKSQGSEFAHTALVLPYVYSPVITRELVYTAMTRAKNELSLYGSKKVLRRAIETPTKRRSGLALQFEQLNSHHGIAKN
ncbi:exodeoxyribonuclease V subunit alpha [Providencia alcalifaciens]|uniref:exodeoxyribonuclease V subunit alpha n=1 Tax=Providencia alcalifaciens TaxID=126385 RepID=UPI00044A5C30|nr:exodeoxyribonuclease V subunit alpha [Providencia alcalifaciens]EUC95874.1 exodeoxyribonuclease V, alpha subunit [Providencia alcalifaciens PAL-2]MTB33014.1 exodeoxyribonuclease V subunit alpha [Providencia alcalifaciens]MTC99269.1 exodeoxyribonuclease V subunit alpha [Providencia alcalifaciens]